MQSTEPVPERAHFDGLITAMKEAVARADVAAALSLAEEAVAFGHEIDDPEMVDRAMCNRASYLIALNRGDEAAREQQMLLMRSRDPNLRYFAAYNLSLICDRREAFDKSRFYSRLALDHAHQSGSIRYIGHAHNRLANVLVMQSYFEEAAASCREALAVLPAEEHLERAMVGANAGYCELVLERFGAGFAFLFGALRTLRRLGEPDWERMSGVRLSLCYGYIEVDRFDRARIHGEEALRAAEGAGDEDRMKKALYLLGEVEKRSGCDLAAYSHFSRLRDEHFPDNPDLANLLMQADTHRLVNLLA